MIVLKSLSFAQVLDDEIFEFQNFNLFFFPSFSLERTENKAFAIGNCTLRMRILGNSCETVVLMDK